ncbi:hypothetical protein DKG77_10245 [Flagellimonas aquimarina]|uniref:Uncharacterized protein n=1 Tax=Flagellimonas aquimarina TaxID=2201895 RepID=A0A316L2N3_9FLAO|nr:hypothetical protein [Allomuricauda koreensis]PWL39215.1 hypothetical protein DKG77_10245 [Allomuricauda koreensis]
MISLKTYKEFRETLVGEKPQDSWPLALQSLWWAAKGDWDASHNIAQDLHTKMGSRIHAYLHRVEGDEWNAGYWYRKAGKPFPHTNFEKELNDLVAHVLKI